MILKSHRYHSRLFFFAGLLSSTALSAAQDLGSASSAQMLPQTRQSNMPSPPAQQYENVNKIDKNGMRLLHYAAMNGEIHDVKNLIDHGAKLAPMDMNGETPLHCAASKGQ